MTLVRIPCGSAEAIRRVPLPRRPESVGRVIVVETMPHGSGVQQAASAIADGFERRGIDTETLLRRVFLAVDPDDQERILARSADAAIVVVGPSTSVLSVSFRACELLENQGLPCVLVVPRQLRSQREYESDNAELPLRFVEYDPTTGPDLGSVMAALTDPLSLAERIPVEAETGDRGGLLRGDPDELAAEFEARGWTDGLPIVLPTPDRVAAMLEGTSRSADTLVAERLPPIGGRTTVADVAVVAVMAGADPVHFPIILAGASLASDSAFESMTRSVNSFAFAQLVSGPYARAAGMQGGLGALSPGTKANAVVGRALALLQRTVGGARVGATTSPAQGNAAAWAFAFTENDEESPWTPYHESRGFSPERTTVTLFSGGQAHLGNFYYDGLSDIAKAMTAVDLFSGALVLISAKRAAELAKEGLSREDVEARLHDQATVSLERFRDSGFFPLRSSGIELGDAGTWPQTYLTGHDSEQVPAFPPGGVQVAVVGSALSSLVQVWFMRAHRTAVVDEWF